jgi:hypothetical protein
MDDVLREKMPSRRDHSVLDIIGLLVLAAALVLISPGAIATFAFEHAFRVPLDVGQRWTFAVAASVAMASFCCIRSRSRYGWNGAGTYTVFAFLTAGAMCVARWGFHSTWAAEFFTAYIP